MIKTDIIGSLTQDPRTNTVNDTTFCNLRLASNKKRKNKEGNYEEETTFLNASAIGKPAETLGKYLSKGSKVYLSHDLVDTEYTNKEGNQVRDKELRIREFEFLGGKADGAKPAASNDGEPF